MSCHKENKENNNNKIITNYYYNIRKINTNQKNNNNSVSPTSSKYKKIENYLIIKTIGRGTFSTVKLGLHLPTHQKVAIKILDKNKIKDENDIRRISREIHILSKLYHPNIAQLYETINSDKHIYIIMEYMEGYHLFNYINKVKRLNEIKASKFFVQLISCLEYIHTLGIVHRDIKPENILLNKNKSKIKLVDFGLSNSYKYGTLLNTACGSPCYAPPEMISGKEYEPLYSDLWSCGVVLYCMLVGKLPFDDEDIKILYKNIKLANFIIPNFLSNSAKDLLKKILNCNPNKRIRLNDIKKHPFYLIGEKDMNYIDKGILIGLEEIPVNESIVKKMKIIYFKDNKKINENYIINNIKNNNHNEITVIYYLMVKKLEEIKDNIHNDTKIKLLNAENNIRNIRNINYNKKIKEKKIEKKNINESENISENNCNIEENSKINNNKGNILNINNIRKLIFNSNDISSLKTKYNKDRFNVVVINNILTETPQNNKTKFINKNINNYITNNLNENRAITAENSMTKKKRNISHKKNNKNLSRNERQLYINNSRTNISKKINEENSKDNKKLLKLKKLEYKFNNIKHVDINNNKSYNLNISKNKCSRNKSKDIKNKIINKTNRNTKIKYGLNLDNNNNIAITKREEKNKKYLNNILTNFNTKRNNKNINLALIKKNVYNSNTKIKKKNINIYINHEDLVKEKRKNNSCDKKIVKNEKNIYKRGVLKSLINYNDNSLKKDLKKKKLKISYSKPKSKSKDKNNINNINVVLSINDETINNNKNNNINTLKNSRNNSCKNKDVQKKYNIKRLNYNFSSSNIKKKKIHLISQIRPNLYSNNKSKQSNSKKKNN